MHFPFRFYGASVTGSSHVKRGTPNQDAFGYESLDNGIQILAVSDGHGGLAHIHSDRGAKIAVDVAIERCKSYFEAFQIETVNTAAIIDDIRFQIEEKVSREIQETWLECIRKEADFKDVAEFGCTLLVAICTQDRLYLMQLGDGKIAIVYEDGVVYYPMPKDEYSTSHMTRSLSHRQAWLEMKTADVALENSIHMIALATDGIENAYPGDYYDDASFHLNLARINHEEIASILPDMLSQAECYSKDDCTAVLLKNCENRLIETDSMLSDPIIWFGEHALQSKSFTELAELPLNVKLELAIRMVDALDENDWQVPKFLTLKGFYYDESNLTVEWMPGPTCQMLTTEQLKKWLFQWLEIAMDFSALSSARSALTNLQKQLRFDYETQTFYMREGAEGHILALHCQQGTFELFHNANLFLHQLIPLRTYRNRHIASVVRHEKYPEIWGLVNRTAHTWAVYGSHQQSVLPGRTLTLRKGVTFYVYGLPVRIGSL